MAAIRKINSRQPARRKPVKKSSSTRRISPLKPGLTGARNWATAQVRAASYSRKKMMRLVVSGLIVFLAVLWSALWLGGFIPNIQASGAKFTKSRLMAMGFVVDHVDIVGEGRISEAAVRAQLGVQPGDYLFDMDIKTAQARIQSLSWVETAVIRRLWPNRVVVHINERRPFALWQNNEIIQVADNTGTIIFDADVSNFNALPLVIGPGAAEHASDIIRNLTVSNLLQERVAAIVFVGQRRWDLVLHDGTRILLPEGKSGEAISRITAFHEKNGLLDLDLERIDMRIEGRLMLKPGAQIGGRRA